MNKPRLEEMVPPNLCETSSRPHGEFFDITKPLLRHEGRVKCPRCAKWLRETSQGTFRRHVRLEGA